MTEERFEAKVLADLAQIKTTLAALVKTSDANEERVRKLDREIGENKGARHVISAVIGLGSATAVELANFFFGHH